MNNVILSGKFAILFGLVVLLGPACGGFSINISFSTPKRAESTATETAAMPAGARLVVSNDNGSTRVTIDPSATQATVEATRIAVGSTQADADALLAQIVVTVTAPTLGDNTLRVAAPRPAAATGTTGDLDFTLTNDELTIVGVAATRRVAVVQLRITLPLGHEVSVTGKSGAIRAVDLDAASTLMMEDGTVRTIDARAAVAVEVERGQIQVEGHRGGLDAAMRDGFIGVEVRTLAAGQSVDCVNRRGPINLDVPRDLDAELTARVDDGVVIFNDRDFDTVTVAVRTFRRVVATLNGGGPTINLNADNGTIDIDGD